MGCDDPGDGFDVGFRFGPGVEIWKGLLEGGVGGIEGWGEGDGFCVHAQAPHISGNLTNEKGQFEKKIAEDFFKQIR